MRFILNRRDQTNSTASSQPITSQQALNSLSSIARLDTMVTVVDASTFGADVFSDQTLMERWGATDEKKEELAQQQREASKKSSKSKQASALAAEPAEQNLFEPVPEDDDRSVSKLMVEQLEFANVILINKTDLASPSAF